MYHLNKFYKMFYNNTLSELEIILSLPCVMASIPLMETPIIKYAKQIEDLQIFRHTVNNGESLEKFLERIYDGADEYQMDCSIFAQLVSRVLSGDWYEDDVITLSIDDGRASGLFLWADKHLCMGYISVIDVEAANILQSLPIDSKGQWVYQIDDNLFLGLSSYGPKILTLEEWVGQLSNDIYSWIISRNTRSYVLNCDILELANKLLLRAYYTNDRINNWGLYFIQGRPTIVIKLSMNSSSHKSYYTIPPSDVECYIIAFKMRLSCQNKQFKRR